MKNIKPFGPSIGKTKISKKFFDKLNKEFDTKSISKKNKTRQFKFYKQVIH